MLRILITNDDGISDDGIIRLASIAKEFGEVWVAAPDGQRSSASHSISLHTPIDVYPHSFPVEGVHAFACSGTPADCVRLGCLNIVPAKPDAVFSGINRGYNVATDIQYSATAGAAFEGAFQGVLSAAFSEEDGGLHEAADEYLPRIIREILGKKLDYGQIFNVNIPGCPLSEIKGIKYGLPVSRGMFFRDRYKVLEELPDGGVRYMVDGQYNEDAEEGTDFRAVVDKYISVGIANNIK